jgi:hypothetical protein
MLYDNLKSTVDKLSTELARASCNGMPYAIPLTHQATYDAAKDLQLNDAFKDVKAKIMGPVASILSGQDTKITTAIVAPRDEQPGYMAVSHEALAMEFLRAMRAEGHFAMMVETDKDAQSAMTLINRDGSPAIKFQPKPL